MAHQPYLQQQPLPQNPFHEVNNTLCYNAYRQCLLNENNARNNERRLVYARCLGYLILEAPNHRAQGIIANEIVLCDAGPDEMDTLAQFYIDHLFYLFRQQKGYTPASSEHSSRDSFEEYEGFSGSVAESAPKDHKTAKRNALSRDDYRCMVTRNLDRTTYSKMTIAERQTHHIPGSFVVATNFCHIFPPLTSWDLKLEENDQRKTGARSIRDIINGFGGIDVLEELDGVNAHRLSNGLTMEMSLHKMFDKLELWFEEVVDSPNTYTVQTLYSKTIDPVLANLPNPLVVTFTTSTNLELPNPKYLKLHAAICRIAHMSGTAAHMALCDRELEEIGSMAHDGSSVELLNSQLRQAHLVS